MSVEVKGLSACAELVNKRKENVVK